MPVVLTGRGVEADRKLILEKNSGCCNIPFRRRESVERRQKRTNDGEDGASQRDADGGARFNRSLDL